MLNKHERL